jgi:hypothetical protein
LWERFWSGIGNGRAFPMCRPAAPATDVRVAVERPC